MIKILHMLCLGLIAVGVLLRSVEVINRNYVFGYDQGRDYMAARRIAVDRKLTLIGAETGAGYAGISGLFHGPGYFYLLALLVFVFRGDPYGAMVVLFVLGVGTIAGVYFLGKKVFGKEAGLIAATLTAISPPLAAQSRMIWAPNFAVPFLLLALYSVYGLGRNLASIGVAAFLSASLYNFEIPIAASIGVSLVLYCLIVVKLRSIKQYAVLIGGFILGFLPMIVFELRHGLAIKGIRAYFEGQMAQPFHPAREFIGDFSAFVYNFYDTFPRQDFLPIALLGILLAASLFVFARQERSPRVKNYLIYLLALPLSSFGIFYVFRNPIYGHYLVSLHFVYILLVSYGMVRSMERKHIIFTGLFLLYFLSYVLFTPISYVSLFRKDIKDYGGTVKIRGKTDALDAIYTDAKGQLFGIHVFTPPVYTYPYDYLLLWYGKEKYGYVPTDGTKGLYYLLIEKDPEKPWSYQGWLKTVIKDGAILETKELPSGFIIQKRMGKSPT